MTSHEPSLRGAGFAYAGLENFFAGLSVPAKPTAAFTFVPNETGARTNRCARALPNVMSIASR